MRIFHIFLASLFALALAACTSGASAPAAAPTSASQSGSTGQSTTNVRIAYQKGGLALVAIQRGLVEKQLAQQGITVSWVGPLADAPTGYETLRARSADFFSSATAPAISALAAGTPMKFVAATKSTAEGRAFLVNKTSSIQSVRELVGKSVAVQRGNVAEYTLLKTLETDNIDKDRVNRVYISPQDAAIALGQAKVDAWVTWDPYVSIAETQGNARIIADGSAAPDYGVTVVRSELLDAQPEIVKKVMTALQSEAAWASANLNEATQLEIQQQGLPADVARAVASRPRNYDLLPVDETVVTSMQGVATWLSDAGVIPSPVDVSKFVAPGMVTPQK
ncbi:MAG: aliphatic sulfonate ABC transporter substrate-binding protein [Chloroflexi bacterium]|nr:aliphatic sulfonate ABC transporter substrate-binding protein [Chloroflexota bacterium]MBV9897242.1 aliphatic sulfonate ABC transporter substrate-binding protein [Chloroflexota bacterium]